MTAASGSPRRAVWAVCAGNTLEWFDWTVYATFSTYFASRFFDTGDSVSNLLSTMAVFAAGFLARPLGGLLFGAIADRRGRRLVMVVTMSLVGASSVLVAVAPSYHEIGAAASAWLLIARCLQGLGHGGEMGGAYTYIAESAPPHRRALWGSTIVMSMVAGTVLATLLNALMQLGMSSAAMSTWGWRIPFALGGFIALVALYFRRRLTETETFTRAANRRFATGNAPVPEWRVVLRGVWESRAMILRVVVFVGSTSVFFYTWSANAPAYAVNFLGVDDGPAMWAGVISNGLFILALPLFAALADRLGRRFNFVTWGLAAAGVSFPLFWMLDDSATSLVLAMSLALLINALAGSTQVAWFGELFRTGNRAIGVGFSVSLASAIFGGTAPYLNEWLTSIGSPDTFIWYLVGLALCTAATALFSPETKGSPLDEQAVRYSASESPRESA